ncbi:DUF3429 domain-containing protein [Roseospira visakhapatnamensis]|uniref:DUF3429 domain-containing protein n=1 Tax=Roseospira visakhapatnamensis TaxID=390880 RepID=A0A7W6WA25_9PROT|nr:DUF3429 domain-containing protein [Roseospira visakhapatnamensis]MBB4266012.1 hypothetical protein [Roseospira visakhapatnamensis]
MRSGSPVPAPVVWLSAAGLLPFLAGAGLSWAGHPPLAETAAFAVLTYGALILSFLGGIVWGVAASVSQRLTEENAVELFALSALPPLVGWSALFLNSPHGYSLLALAFLGQLVLDKRMRDMRLVPGWWLGLRLALTSGVILCLVLTAMAQVVSGS